MGLKNQKDYVRIFKGDKGACWAYLGKVGGEQPISLGEGCPGIGVVTHEIMHTLGKQKYLYYAYISRFDHKRVWFIWAEIKIVHQFVIRLLARAVSS